MELTMSMFATQADYWKARAEQAEKDRDHWKNNHATEVRRARALKERTDMPLERVEAYEKWGEDLARLSAAEKERDEALARTVRLEEILHHADSFILAAPHGDNCFVSDHYEGDPGNRCNCGKDSALDAIYNVLTEESLDAALSHLRQEIRREALEEAATFCESKGASEIAPACFFANGIRKLAEQEKQG